MGTKFVGFFGPDGVGKSTHVALLESYLKSKGYKVKTVWMRGPHTLAFVVSSILFRLGRTRETVNPYGRVKKVTRISSHTIWKNLWALVELVSVIPIIVLKVIIPKKLGYNIIADRYVPDTIVSIAYTLEDAEFVDGRIAHALMTFIPTESFFFHLDADYPSLKKRRGKLVEPEAFIEFQKKCYQKIGSLIPNCYIDTSDTTVEQTASIIQTPLNKITNCEKDDHE